MNFYRTIHRCCRSRLAPCLVGGNSSPRTRRIAALHPARSHEAGFREHARESCANDYKEVEFAGYFGKSPQEVRKILDSNKLTSPSEHIPYETIEEKWPETLEAAHAVGQKFIVCPWLAVSQRNAPDGWRRAAETFNRAGEAAHKAGIQFAYHNHAFEFEPSQSLGGKLPYDFLLEEPDRKLVKMEMYLCWIIVGGQDPVKYFDRDPAKTSSAPKTGAILAREGVNTISIASTEHRDLAGQGPVRACGAHTYIC